MKINVIGTPDSVMKAQISALDNTDDDISEMKEGDFLILCGLDDIVDHEQEIIDAFDRGVVVALEHVDSDDIDYLTEILGFDNDYLFDDQNAEFYALAIREISDDIYPFTYIFTGFNDDSNYDDDTQYNYVYTIESGDKSATYTALLSGDQVVSFDVTYTGTSEDWPANWWKVRKTSRSE